MRHRRAKRLIATNARMRTSQHVVRHETAHIPSHDEEPYQRTHGSSAARGVDPSDSPRVVNAPL